MHKAQLYQPPPMKKIIARSAFLILSNKNKGKKGMGNLMVKMKNNSKNI